MALTSSRTVERVSGSVNASTCPMSASIRWMPSIPSTLCAEHRRMARLQNLAIPQIHVHAARQAGIEAANGPHDVDTAEVLGAIFLENRRLLYRVLVRTRRPVDIPGCRIPRRRWIGM